MSNHISNSDSPLPAGCTGLAVIMKEHKKIIIKEKCYGRIDSIGNRPGASLF